MGASREERYEHVQESESSRLHVGRRDGAEGIRIHEARTPRSRLSSDFHDKVWGQAAKVAGNSLAALGLNLSAEGIIIKFRGWTSSSKGELTVKDKMVGRRSAEEVTFLTIS